MLDDETIIGLDSDGTAVGSVLTINGEQVLDCTRMEFVIDSDAAAVECKLTFRMPSLKVKTRLFRASIEDTEDA